MIHSAPKKEDYDMRQILFGLWYFCALLYLGFWQFIEERHTARHRDEVGT